MNRNLHNSRGTSTHDRNQTPRWRTVFIALALALTIGGAGQIPMARAQNLWVHFVDVINPRLVVCPNQTVTYRVQLKTTGSRKPEDPPETEIELLRPTITLTADVADASLGEFTQTSTFMFPIPGSGLKVPDTAEFTFKAKNKLGKTVLTFGATDIGFDANPFKVAITVQPCKFKVIAISNFFFNFISVDGGGYIPTQFTAATYETRVTVDSDGAYTGQAPVIWFSREDFGPGHVVVTWTWSQVNITGRINEESGQLVLKLTYLPAQQTKQYSAGIPGAIGTNSISVSPLIVTVPSAGGTVPLQQTLTGPPQYGEELGTVKVYVIPVVDAK